MLPCGCGTWTQAGNCSACACQLTGAPPVPLWDFDFRCTPTGCWIAVPLTRGKLALYEFGKIYD